MGKILWLLVTVLFSSVLACGECGDDDSSGDDSSDTSDTGDTSETDDTETDDTDTGTDGADAGTMEAEWPIPPTDQHLCYNRTEEVECPNFPCEGGGPDFCGQDVQYVKHPRKFTESTVGSDTVVTDSLTGLVWQKPYVRKMWQEAFDYCEGLTYGGESDWRLPDMHELASLLHYGRHNPASIFPDMPSEYFWSSDKDVTPYDGMAWMVGYIFGLVRQNLNHEDIRAARCVRGDSPAAIDDPNRFAVSDDDTQKTVLDQATGLIWQKKFSVRKNWKQSLAYCEGLEYGGFDDWRLPNVQEMRTLINLAITDPSSDFPGLPADYFWTSSSSTYYTNNAWCLHFPLGSVLYADKTIGIILSEFGMVAKCVRGGP
ncbi:MAG: DUF1566 domain-containing protein [Proteobacteria bacterium]|nr:DUF1566 domain-containing protein [Pseudomonadota bacterium]